MEPFHQLPSYSATRNLPSPQSPLRRFDLNNVTNDWLSLTLDPSASTPTGSLTTNPVPPTPRPLPNDFTTFPKASVLKAPSPVPPQGGFNLPPQMVSRSPLIKDEKHNLDRTPATMPRSQSALPRSSFSSPLPDSTLQYNSGKELAKKFHVSKPEVMFCTEPEQIKSPSKVPPCHSLNVQVNKSSKIPDLGLQDPYEVLLSMILEGCNGTDDADFSRLSPVDSPPATLSGTPQSNFKLEIEESYQPAVETTAVTPASDSAGHVGFKVYPHQPVTGEPLINTWQGQTKSQSEQPIVSLRPPSEKRCGYTELFIEEEEETKEDKEEDIVGFNGRLSPQVEGMV